MNRNLAVFSGRTYDLRIFEDTEANKVYYKGCLATDDVSGVKKYRAGLKPALYEYLHKL